VSDADISDGDMSHVGEMGDIAEISSMDEKRYVRSSYVTTQPHTISTPR